MGDLKAFFMSCTLIRY